MSFFRCAQVLALGIVQAAIDSNLVSNWNRNKVFNIWLTAVNVLPNGITPKTAQSLLHCIALLAPETLCFRKKIYLDTLQ